MKVKKLWVMMPVVIAVTAIFSVATVARAAETPRVKFSTSSGDFVL